jgi:cell division ATPase FtsA
MVITGGAARMTGILEAAAEITGHQVEPGIPRGISADSKLVGIPEMATVIGLIKHGAKLRIEKAGKIERSGYKEFANRVTNFFNKLK